MLGCNVSVKVLRSHFNYFPENLDYYSEEHDERFHQDIRKYVMYDISGCLRTFPESKENGNLKQSELHYLVEAEYCQGVNIRLQLYYSVNIVI